MHIIVLLLCLCSCQILCLLFLPIIHHHHWRQMITTMRATRLFQPSRWMSASVNGALSTCGERRRVTRSPVAPKKLHCEHTCSNVQCTTTTLSPIMMLMIMPIVHIIRIPKFMPFNRLLLCRLFIIFAH